MKKRMRTMSDTRAIPLFLLSRFAEFYEEVASIKIAITEGRLSAYLASDDEPAPTRGADLALRVSSRLTGILRAQARDVAARGTTTEIKAYTMAQYVMAALADEIFILDPELPWAGRDAWLEVLLEHKLFRTGDAGQRFFTFADEILHAPERTALHTDLASVFLLALQLGFKGRYRGEHGAEMLRGYRRQLYNFTRQQSVADPSQPAFLQAYQHLLQEEKGERYAPLSRWFALGRIALVAYLVVSTLVWVALMHPFEKTFGG
jgi:type VI secretion system protein ImpK